MKFTKRNILKNKKKQETKTKRNKHKITKKRVNKLKTTSKKIGGQHPKINYAYTYLIFNYQDYKKYIFSQPFANIFILHLLTFQTPILYSFYKNYIKIFI
jgi:hypothetical protein